MREPSGTRVRTPCVQSVGLVRIAIADPHELVVAGLTHLISAHSGGRYRIVTAHAQVPPDVVLYGIDRDRDESSHDPELHALLRSKPSKVIVTYWDDDSPAIQAALACGAHGALSLKITRDELLEGIQRVIQGRKPEVAPPSGGPCHPAGARAGLTSRELDVLGLVAIGLTNQEIADRLYLSINSVKTYIRGAYQKIGAERRAQAVVWVERHGGLTPAADVPGVVDVAAPSKGVGPGPRPHRHCGHASTTATGSGPGSGLVRR